VQLAIERLWRFLRRAGCERDLAEDLAQDACLAALHHGIDRLGWDMAGPWLQATARNLLRSHRRAAQRRLLQIPRTDAWPADMREDERDIAMRSALRRCLLQLTPRARRALELRYREQLGWRAIADELQIAPGGAKSLLRRARQELRTCVERKLS